MLVPTVVSKPRPRQRRPNAIASLTEPPLESSTTVAPARSRPCAKLSKSFGLSWVMMPTALIQPWQFGSQATQLKCIGSLRSSSEAPAFAVSPSVAVTPGSATVRATAPSSAQPRMLSDFTSLNLVPSRKPLYQGGDGPAQTPTDSVILAYSKT